MIKYVVTDERATARFDTQGSTDKQYWADNITTNICRLIKSTIFCSLIYTIAWKYVERRSSFTGVMNEPPNIEVGQNIAKQRLLMKYNDLEQKVYNKFVEYIKELKCVKSLINSHKLAMQELSKIDDVIQSYRVTQTFLDVHKGGLI